jgi:hypothetical protein
MVKGFDGQHFKMVLHLVWEFDGGRVGEPFHCGGDSTEANTLNRSGMTTMGFYRPPLKSGVVQPANAATVTPAITCGLLTNATLYTRTSFR